jgi:hypothetical protein
MSDGFAPSRSISCSCAIDNKSSPSLASMVFSSDPFESLKWTVILEVFEVGKTRRPSAQRIHQPCSWIWPGYITVPDTFARIFSTNHVDKYYALDEECIFRVRGGTHCAALVLRDNWRTDRGLRESSLLECEASIKTRFEK